MPDFTTYVDEIKRQIADIENALSNAETFKDQTLMRNLNRSRTRLTRIIELYDRFIESQKRKNEAEHLMSDPDPEIAQMAQEEIPLVTEECKNLEQQFYFALLPPDPNDDKNIIMEIRAGTGGEEAALFAADLFRMYSRYAETKGWNIEMLSINETDLQGIKEVIFSMNGQEVYSKLKFESGTHRVQRVPDTEQQGRIHTSAATVAVLPEAEDLDVEIIADDLKIDVFRAGGHGGQHVNKTESAVRITHIPSGLVVTCQDEKSQLKNKAKALKVLRARLYDLEQKKQQDQIGEARRQQVGSGDRSERIPTYNFPQNRLTDHRIGLTHYKLDSIIEGNLDDVVKALRIADQSEKLKSLSFTQPTVPAK